mgnify:FL=1|jgi:hypothetical protein
MPDHHWTYQDKVVIAWIVVLSGLIMLSRFNVAPTILLSIFGGSAFVTAAGCLWVLLRDRMGRD